MGSGNSKECKVHQEVNNLQTQISSPTASQKADISVSEKSAIASSEYRKAISQLKNKNFEEALAELNQVDEKYPISADVQYWKAISYLGLRDLAKAEEYCILALKIDSKHKKALAELGNIQILTQKYEEAYKSFSELMLIDEKSFEAHMGLGYVRMHVDDFNTAQQHYESAMDCGNYIMAELNYGHMLAKQKNYEMAFQFYNKTTERDPNFLSGFLSIANLYLLQQKHQELINFCDKKLKRESWKIHYLSLKSQGYFGIKEFDESRKLCEQILEIDPQNIDALYGIAMSQKGQRQYPQSQKTIAKILEINPKCQKALRVKAKMYIYMKSYQQVIETCDQLFEIDQNDSVAFYYRAQAYMEMKAFGKAIEDFDKAINFEQNPSFNLDVYKSKAKCHLEFKQYKELQNCYDYMIALTSEVAEKVSLYLEKGKYFIKTKQLDHAYQCFNRAIKLEKNSIEVQLRVANIYRDNQQIKLAILNYDKIIEQKPKYVQVYLEKAILQEMQSNFQEVINLCNKALSYQDDFVDAIILRGRAKVSLQLFNDAIRDFSRVIELQRTNHQAHFELGLIYYVQTDFEKASEYFDKAVALASQIEKYHEKRALTLSLQEFDREAIKYLVDAIEQYPHFENCKHLLETLQNKPKHIREYTNVYVFILVLFFDLAEQLSTSNSELVSEVKTDYILEILNLKLRETFPNIKNLFEIIRYFILNKFDCRIFISSEEFVKTIYEIYKEKYEDQNLTKHAFVSDIIELAKKIAKLKEKQLKGQQSGSDKLFYQDFLKVIPEFHSDIFVSQAAGFAVKDVISTITFLMINSNKIKIEQKNLKTILFSITKNGFLEKLKLK